MLPNFNRELDRIRGSGTEQQLAARLGISPDALVRYRRGELPRGVRRLAIFPALLAALARDSSWLVPRGAQVEQLPHKD